MPITQSGGALLVSGATTVDAGTGAISLLQVGNNFNSVSLTGNGIGVTDGDNLSLAALTSTGHGAVVVTAAGTLSLPSQTLTVGNSNLTLASNGGALSTAADLGGNNVTLFGRDGLTLGHGVTANTLALSSTNAAIVQNTGALGVVGASTVDAGSAGIVLNSGSNRFGAGISLTGTGMIVLDAIGNDFQGTVHARGSSIAIVDRNDLAATAQASDALRLQAGGQLTTAGTLSANTIALRGGTGVVLGHDVAAASVALSGGGAITQNAGSLRAGQLSVNAAGAVMLTGSGNAIDTLGDFSAQGLDLVSNRSLLVSGRVDGGPSLRLRSGGDLQLSGQLSGAASWLQAVAGIRQRAGSSITSGQLSGGAGRCGRLHRQPGRAPERFHRQRWFQLHQRRRSVAGARQWRQLQRGCRQQRDVPVGTRQSVPGWPRAAAQRTGTFAATGQIGTQQNPIYVIGTGTQTVAAIGPPPAYFNAITVDGSLLDLAGGSGFTVPASAFAGRAQSSASRTVAFVDLSASGTRTAPSAWSAPACVCPTTSSRPAMPATRMPSAPPSDLPAAASPRRLPRWRPRHARRPFP